jgi:hypothetical protein
MAFRKTRDTAEHDQPAETEVEAEIREFVHTAGRGGQEIRVVSYVGYVGGGLEYLVKSMISAGGNFLAHRRDELPGADEMLAGGIV